MPADAEQAVRGLWAALSERDWEALTPFLSD